MNQPAVAAFPSASGAPSMRSGFSTCSNGSVSFSGARTPTQKSEETDGLEPHERSPAARRGRSRREQQQDQYPREEGHRPDVRADECRVRASGEGARFRDEGVVAVRRGEHRDGEDDPDDAEEPADGVSGSSPRDERSDGGERDGRDEHDGVVPATVDRAEGERARSEREGQAEGHPGERRAHVGRTECRDQRILRQGARARQPRGREASHGWKAAAATVPGPLRRP